MSISCTRSPGRLVYITRPQESASIYFSDSFGWGVLLRVCKQYQRVIGRNSGGKHLRTKPSITGDHLDVTLDVLLMVQKEDRTGMCNQCCDSSVSDSLPLQPTHTPEAPSLRLIRVSLSSIFAISR